MSYAEYKNRKKITYPIHILYVVSDLLEGHGGIQSLLMSICRHIDPSRVQIDFVVHNGCCSAFSQSIKEAGGQIYQAPQFKKVGPISYVYWWHQFFKKHPEYTIVHGHMKAYISLYLWIAKLHKCVTIAHSHSAFPKMKLLKKYIEKIALFPLRWVADYHFACSLRAGEYLYGKHITKKKSFRFIPNARDTRQFAYNPNTRIRLRTKLGLTDSFVVGHVGNFVHAKNHHFLLQIFAEISKVEPNSKLLLVGDGPYLTSIQQEVKKLGLEHAVCFMGLCSNPQDYYQAMDLFILPSFSEGLPLVLLEAQISGLPCLSSAHLPKEVDLGCGLLYDMPLTCTAKEWGDKALSLPSIARKSYTEQAVKKGFEITELVAQLTNFYIKLEHDGL